MRISFISKIVAPLVLIGVTAGATYLALSATFAEERATYDANMETFSNRSRSMIEELRAARMQLSKLEGWREFVQVQHDLNAINTEINALNFGNALDHLDKVMVDLRSGALGPRFQEGQDVLLPPLEECARGLRRKNERARSHLVDFNQRALQLLSGFHGGGPEEEPGAAASDQQEPPAADLEVPDEDQAAEGGDATEPTER